MAKAARIVGVGMVAVLLGACSGSAGPAGPAGATGAAGSPGAAGATGATGPAGASSASDGGAGSFSLIDPRVGITGRELDVTVSVEGAVLDSKAAIDFGDPKVAVSNVQLVSATTLYAHLTIDPSATLGAHDVTVKDGAISLKGTGAFNVSPPISVTVTAGAPKQGAIFAADLHSADTSNFFDPNAANFTVAATDQLQSLGNANITPNDVTAYLLVPPASTAGPAQVTVQNDPSSSLTWASEADAITIVAQAPTALALPFTQSAATIAAAGDSVYESASSPGTGILNYTIDVTDPSSLFLPEGIVFPASGLPSDIVAVLAPPQGLFGPNPPPFHLIASIPNTTSAAMPTSLVLFDQALGGGSGYAYNVSVTNTPVSAVTAEATTAHGTTATAQAVTLPAIVTGSLSASGEIDAYKVTIPANATFEFGLSGMAAAIAAVPADQTALAIDEDNDVFASGGQGAFVDTEEFPQVASPATTTMYFVVTTDPNADASTQTGAYTVTLRISQ